MTAPEERASRLTEIRNLKMARSAHAYVRGSTVSFYEWLNQAGARIPEGPPVWICGDCHLGNLGPVADARGRVAVQIRDLDQTVIGNPAHDLVRLGLSLASAARGSDLPGVVTARILEHLVAGYETALAGDFDHVRERSWRPKSIRGLIDRSVRRRWRHLQAERLATAKPTVPLGKRFWALAPEERAALGELFTNEALGEDLARLNAGPLDRPVRMVDAAYWMKGCSSLGRLRFAVMLRIGEGKAAVHRLVDVKEAAAAAAPRTPGAGMPRDNGQRVVAGARALSPNLGERMIARRLLDVSVVVRELMPQDLKIDIDRLDQEEAQALAAYLAGVVGRAHGRQMDSVTRGRWLADFAKARTASLEAPTWLWSSVVDLLAIHERAYLEHCRTYALRAAI